MGKSNEHAPKRDTLAAAVGGTPENGACSSDPDALDAPGASIEGDFAGWRNAGGAEERGVAWNRDFKALRDVVESDELCNVCAAMGAPSVTPSGGVVWGCRRCGEGPTSDEKWMATCRSGSRRRG